MDNDKLLTVVCNAIDEKFGEEITALYVGEVTVLANYFIIASASSKNQLKALADNVLEKMHKAGGVLNHSEGYPDSTWVLLDFSDIIVHLFQKDDRQFYNLERIWKDAVLLDIPVVKANQNVDIGGF